MIVPDRYNIVPYPNYYTVGAIIAPPCWPIPMYKPVEMPLAGCPQKALSQNKGCKAARVKKKMLRK